MKLKPTAKPVKSPRKSVEVENLPPDPERRHPGSMPTSLAANPLGMSEDRKSLYQEANEFHTNGDVTPSPESEEGSETPGVETPATSPEEEATETSPEEEETQEEISEARKGEELEESTLEAEGEERKGTMVPHAALHEERESHKETKAKLSEALELVKEAQAQLKVYGEEVSRLKELPKPEPEPKEDEPIVDMEAYVRGLGKRVNDLVGVIHRSEEQRADEAESRRVEKMRAAIALVDKELSDQGLPGFEKFSGLVAEKVEQKCKGDRKLLLRWDNPEGWAEVYRTEVYPEMAGVLKIGAKEEKKQTKEELKGKANMSSQNGKPPAKPNAAPKKEWGLTDYFDHRSKQRIA